MNIKNTTLFMLVMTTFMAIGADKTDINNQLKKLDEQAQNSERTYRKTLFTLSKSLQSKTAAFLGKKDSCLALGYKDNMHECPQFEEIRNAYLENPQYKQLEELRIQQSTDLCVRNLVREYRDTGMLRVDQEDIFGNLYHNVRDIETETGKAKLAQAIKATRNKVINIIDELEKPQ